MRKLTRKHLDLFLKRYATDRRVLDLRANKLSKGILLILLTLFDRLNWTLKEEYGNISRTSREHQIMPTGYYLAARKSAVEIEVGGGA